MLTLIRCPFHTHGVSAVARESPRSFCQKCRWQVTPKHAYTLDPSKSEWADYAAVQAECGNLSGNELTCNSSGSIWSQSSQLGEPLWTDPGLKSGISLRELISTKKKKKCRHGILPKSSHVRKKPPTHHIITHTLASQHKISMELTYTSVISCSNTPVSASYKVFTLIKSVIFFPPAHSSCCHYISPHKFIHFGLINSNSLKRN